MRKNTILNSMKVCGVTAVAFGFLVFNSGQAAAEEEELGEKLLYQGKTHEHVVELKELLAENDLYNSEELNNVYDKATKEAVLNFQKENNLLVDGLAGIQTISALAAPERGDEGQLVTHLQEYLFHLGYYDFKIDGIFGPITESGVTDFQEDYSVEGDETGVAGPNTYSALYEATQTGPTATTEQSQSQSSGQSDSSSSEQSESSNESDSASNEQSESSSESDSSSNDQSESTGSSQSTTSESSSSSNAGDEVTMTMEATAYTAYCEGCSGITFTGVDLRNKPDKKLIAVDPTVIPLGSIVEVEGYGRAIAGDIGGAIKGNRIDLHMATKEKAINFGRRDVKITIVETP